jgi:hypothetical protein
VVIRNPPVRIQREVMTKGNAPADGLLLVEIMAADPDIAVLPKKPSALARNDPPLLTKSCHERHHILRVFLRPSLIYDARPRRADDDVAAILAQRLTAPTGVDDEPRAGAGATWLDLFSAWSTLSERKWSTSRERRGKRRCGRGDLVKISGTRSEQSSDPISSTAFRKR